MKGFVVGGMVAALGIASCSHTVAITAEVSGTTTGSGAATGTGAAGPGGTSSSGSAGGTSGSSGTGGSTTGPAPSRVVTAETDIGQYQSINVDLLSATPVVQGPFFVTDVVIGNSVNLYTVMGSDCSATQTTVLQSYSGSTQFHGIRLPILAGQSLCHLANGGTLTVLGFRPY